MGRKFWLWLWILALGLLMFFCIKSKLAQIEPKVLESVSSVSKVAEPAPVKSEQPKKVEVAKKDIKIKIEKDANNYLISGIANSKSDFESLSSKYTGLKNQSLSYDTLYENPEAITMLMGLSGILERFKSGYVEYHDKSLIVDGVVSSNEDKELIDNTLASINGVKINANVIVEAPKPEVEHIGKLSVTKEGDIVTISGIFSSEKEIDSLVGLLKDKGLNVKKELCVVDSDLKEDGWKIPFASLLDDFVALTKGTIQFDKDRFTIIGETKNIDIKNDIKYRLDRLADETIAYNSDITYIKPTPTKEQVQEQVNAILKLKHIRFVTATAKLIPESKKVLSEVADILLKNPNLKVRIEGHTDSSGNAKSNLILSQHRADTVKEYLVKKGINSKNLKAVGYGASKPLVKNDTKENKQINRRVEFIIIGE